VGKQATPHARRFVAREGTARRARVPPVRYRDNPIPVARRLFRRIHADSDRRRHAEDERVRSVCLIAVLDRAGVRPIDRPDPDLEDRKLKFDPRAYSDEDLAIIEQGLRLTLAGGSAGREAEVIAPGDG
jgi:hypothetical protein